jgi:hypothetical protein
VYKTRGCAVAISLSNDSFPVHGADLTPQQALEKLELLDFAADVQSTCCLRDPVLSLHYGKWRSRAKFHCHFLIYRSDLVVEEGLAGAGDEAASANPCRRLLQGMVADVNCKHGLSPISDPPLSSQLWRVRKVDDNCLILLPKGMTAVVDVPWTGKEYAMCVCCCLPPQCVWGLSIQPISSFHADVMLSPLHFPHDFFVT